MLVSSTAAERPLFVPETRFGRWFLGTETWFQSVLKVALLDLFRLIDDRKKSYPVVVDVGCGMGRSFRLMKILFRPTRLIGIDYEDENLEAARKRTESERIEVDFLRNDCAAIDLPDASADLPCATRPSTTSSSRKKHCGSFAESSSRGVCFSSPSPRGPTSTRGSSASSSRTRWTCSGRPTNTWQWSAPPASSSRSETCPCLTCGGAARTWGSSSAWGFRRRGAGIESRRW